MALQYDDLEEARSRASAELQADVGAGSVYVGKRLTDQGAAAWPQLLSDALATHGEDWLAAQIEPLQRPVDTREGKAIKRSSIGHETLAQGEFNHYYMRGVCQLAIESGQDEVEVYRAKPVAEPVSDEFVGQRFSAVELLDQLRNNRWKVPFAHANSGVSVRLPR